LFVFTFSMILNKNSIMEGKKEVYTVIPVFNCFKRIVIKLFLIK